MLIRFGRLASLMGSRIVRIPFSNFVWILLVSIGLGKVIDRSNAPATISRESQLCLLLALRLTFGLVLMVVLMAEAASNRQVVLINSQFNIFWSHSWKRNIHLIAVIRFTNIHRCKHSW